MAASWLCVALAVARMSVPVGASIYLVVWMISCRSFQSLQSFLSSGHIPLRRAQGDRRPTTVGKNIFAGSEIKRTVPMSRDDYWTGIKHRIKHQVAAEE